MKRALSLLIPLLCLCLLFGCDSPPEGEEQLTVDIIRELAEKGEDLTWSDLAPYSYYQEIGSSPGEVVRFYTVEPGHSLTVGGDTREKKPADISFYRTDSPYRHIDFRTGDIDAFLKE